MSTSSQTTAFVVTMGDIPLAAALDLDMAQGNALTRQTAWGSAKEYDYRWDVYIPGKVWRLMQRRKGPEGRGRRFSWTTYAVHATEFLAGGAR
ncbi:MULTISPECIES: hypothetical protein [Streptomyces]|uniref:Uncharacterized protein n=2 Tax=Streptomyces TaxID=1883 RepID=A0A2U9P0D7_STRAS|nr:hypothetical protein [Streptomyces actuosus]AWT42615.1 hypothetical protein DMT42_10005 [Streptomyces actuosus]MBM4819830.1 hypothetical protein [Streptomyces actuosus]